MDEWKLLDQIGVELTHILRLSDDPRVPQAKALLAINSRSIIAKDLVNQLKSKLKKEGS